jgi:hypothetical protein
MSEPRKFKRTSDLLAEMRRQLQLAGDEIHARDFAGAAGWLADLAASAQALSRRMADQAPAEREAILHEQIQKGEPE